VTYLVKRLNEAGFSIDQNVFTIEQAKQEILKNIRSAAR
jgi:hypothetical protein